MNGTAPHKAQPSRTSWRHPARPTAVGVLAIAIALFSQASLADEGGVSFWLPGFFGSLAATPQQPGWSLATIYYHTTVSAGSDVALARQFQLAKIPLNLTANLNANLTATRDVGHLIPPYQFP